jgi:hypothetical protein
LLRLCAVVIQNGDWRAERCAVREVPALPGLQPSEAFFEPEPRAPPAPHFFGASMTIHDHTSIAPVRPIAPWLGGKRNLAKRICALIDRDDHLSYAEPFVGMGGIFLRRTRCPRAEFINDRGRDVYTMRLSIKVPNGDFAAAKDGLTSIAEDVVADEHADDYVILLRNGETIKPGEIAVKKLVSLRRSANSFRSDDVLREMTAYLGELQRSGQTEA